VSADPGLGRTFGRVADVYARLRPRFAPEAIDRAVAELGLEPGSVILDLAAGTGRLTRPLRERFAHVLAVEPDDEMRTYVDDARAGYAEAIPVGDGCVDAVFVGDAFTWFQPEQALAEIRRVTTPGGGLALLWVGWWEGEQPRIPPEFREILDEVWVRFEHLRPAEGDWRRHVNPDGDATYTETGAISGRDLADLTLTASGPAYLDDAEREEIAARVYPLMEPEYELTVTTRADWKRL
jgi:SAM-dependent methyltransferase